MDQKIILLVHPAHDEHSIQSWLRLNDFAGLKEIDPKDGCRRFECIPQTERCSKKAREALAQMVRYGKVARDTERTARI